MAAVVPALGTTSKLRPRVLLVDDEPGLKELMRELVGAAVRCQFLSANSISEARNILDTEAVELLVTDIDLPDGDGLSLLATLRRQQSSASAIIISGRPNMDGAISALRGGAADFVPKPFSNDQLAERVRRALERQSVVAKQEKRLSRLRDAVKRLGQARRMVSKKVDLLCNDLIVAYGELSRQLDTVRTEEAFRKYIAAAKDLEQLLCHTMDWILRQLGYANVALWLAGDDGEFQLGAYMKYTIAGEEPLAAAMKRLILPVITRQDFLRTSGEELAPRLDSDEKPFFAKQQIMAVNCTYLGESLAVIIFFRDNSVEFTDGDEAVLRAISPILAGSLASVVHNGNLIEEDGQEGREDREENDDDDKPRRRQDDWWKRGEEPPF